VPPGGNRAKAQKEGAGGQQGLDRRLEGDRSLEGEGRGEEGEGAGNRGCLGSLRGTGGRQGQPSGKGR